MSVNPDTIPRYAPPTAAELERMFHEESPTCGACVYCKGIERRHVCVFETFQADTFDGLSDAIIAYVEPTDDACSDFKEV